MNFSDRMGSAAMAAELKELRETTGRLMELQEAAGGLKELQETADKARQLQRKADIRAAVTEHKSAGAKRMVGADWLQVVPVRSVRFFVQIFAIFEHGLVWLHAP